MVFLWDDHIGVAEVKRKSWIVFRGTAKAIFFFATGEHGQPHELLRDVPMNSQDPTTKMRHEQHKNSKTHFVFVPRKANHSHCSPSTISLLNFSSVCAYAKRSPESRTKLATKSGFSHKTGNEKVDNKDSHHDGY